MKTSLFILFFFLSLVLTSVAQDIQFPSSILTAGSGEKNSINNFRWRIGQVHVLEIKTKNLKSNTQNTLSSNQIFDRGNIKINAFPNPADQFLMIHFDMNISMNFKIDVMDLSGRKLIEEKLRLIIPGETIEMNMINLTSAIYLVNVCNEDKTINKIFRISKHSNK